MAWYDKVGEVFQENLWDPLKEAASDLETSARERIGYGTGRSSAKRDAKAAQARQQKQLQQEKKLQEQEKRRRKSMLMSALGDGGAPDLFTMLGAPQDKL